MERLSARIHRLLARSPFVVNAVIKVRNQAQAVIRSSVSDGIASEDNGEAALVRAVVPSCSTFLDVGANRGEWADLVCRTGRVGLRGACFEPNPELLPDLRSRLLQFSTVQVIGKGLADCGGTLTLHVDEAFSERSSFAGVRASPSPRAHVVEVSTLDREVRELGWETVDLLKIDAEGFDAKVLRGGDGLLREGRVRIIQFEYNDVWADAGETLLATVRFLERHGYRTHLLLKRGLRRLNCEALGEYFGYSNLVSIRQNDMNLVRELLDCVPA